MKILVVGAGAIGGYFGARLLQAGRDVTFLVRPGRKAALASGGLVVKSPRGDVKIDNPPMLLANEIAAPFDLIILSCKAYDLDSAIASIAPAVGEETAILPLLNGMNHLDQLVARFSEKNVLGGQCVIATTMDDAGAIIHLNNMHSLTFGERAGGRTPRIDTIAEVLGGAGFDVTASENILLEMWEKWVFLSTLAASTSLMRATIGDILAAPDGEKFLLGILGEARLVAEKSGYAPRPPVAERLLTNLTTKGSPLNASMARDIARGNKIEADHVVGDLIRRGREKAHGESFTLLVTAYTHLKAYEARREREGK